MDLHYLRSHWASVYQGLVETIAKFREEELDFRPFPASWSVRQIMVHLAHEEAGEFDYGITQVLPEFPAEYNLQDYSSLAAIQSLLASVHAHTTAYLDQLKEEDLERVVETPWGKSLRLIDMIGHLIEHEVHHRGELSLVLGMLGREGLNP